MPDSPLANSPLANPVDPRRQFPSPFATYDFTSIPHEQLQAMVEPANAQKVTDIAHRLTAASTAIKELGDDLKKHMDRVHWQGEGGEAFRGWGSRMSNATLRLGHYAENAGTWMNHAAVTLGQVKRDMPKYSAASKATVDAYLNAQPPNMRVIQEPLVDLPAVGSAPSQRQAYEAQRRLHDDHMHAAELLKKLSESYNASGVQLMRAERPQFPPAPGAVMPPPIDPNSGFEYLPQPSSRGGQGSASHGAADGAAVPNARESGYVAASSREGTSGIGHAASHLQRPVGPEIDSVAPLPTAPSVLPSGAPGGWSAGVNADGVVRQPHLPVPPLVQPGLGTTGPTIGVVRPSVRPSGPGRQSQTGAFPAPAVPRAGGPGVIGGSPLPLGPERPTGQIPRGTVVGGEPGVVGGRPVGGPGSSSGGSIGRPFTPGGTGLPRGSQATSAGAASAGAARGGPVPVSGVPGSASQRGRRGQRPDYLVEDEETWSQGHRRVVPPVIE